MVRCRMEPNQWPLIIDVSNHLPALNPDVPDFQPGKIWKNEIHLLKKEEEVTTKNEMNLNHGSTKRKKPTKKKV